MPILTTVRGSAAIALFAAVFMCILIAAPVRAQDDPGFMAAHSEEKFRELQNYRVVIILSELNLDINSAKGQAVLSLVNKQANDHREFLITRWRLQKDLMHQMRSTPLNAIKVEELVLALEEHHRGHARNQDSYQVALAEILTPVERAKVLMAEEKFRDRLRDAMQKQGRGPGSGRYQRGKPQDNR